MTDLSPDKLLSDLKRFPLLTAAQYVRVEGAAREGTHPPVQVVRRLVEKGWLTGYQGEVLLVGQAETLLFGPYVLLDKLGEGGMGSVFKARHRRLGRIDALKVIRPDKISSKVVARRFLREIRLTSDLHHPHIVRAIDAGGVGRQWYLATEYIAGVDLGTVVRRHGPLPVPEACLAIYQATLALQHVHERGLVHRDIKPSNLIREDKTGVIKLLDLGLSRFRETAGEESLAGPLTTAGVILGTPDFMAPEQAVNPHEVDIRADLYSLGCTFFFLLTGSTPYTGSSSVDKLIAHTSSPIPRVQLPGGPAPQSLEAIVSRLLAKKPEDRYPTPQAVTDALLTLRPGHSPTVIFPGPDPAPTEPVELPPGLVADEWQSAFDLLVTQVGIHAPAPLTRRLPGQSPASGLWWLGVMVVVLVVGLTAYFVARAISRRPTPPSADSAGQTQAVPAPTKEEAPADELRAFRKALDTPGEDHSRLRDRILAFRAKHIGATLTVGATALLRSLPSPLDPIVMEAGPERPWVQVAGAGTTVVGLGFSPTDSQLIVTRIGGRVEEWRFPGRETFDRSADVNQPNGFRSVSTDGPAMLAVRPNGRMVLWPEPSQAWREINLEADLRVRVAGVGPDGKSAVVAFVGDAERLGRVDLLTGRVVGRLDHKSVGVTRITVAPDAATCLVLGQHNSLREAPMVPGRVERSFEPGPRARGTWGGVYGPDGRYLYLTGVETAAGRFPPGATAADIRYEVPAPERSFPLWGSRQEFHSPTCIAVSADETSVAVGTEAGALQVFAAGTGHPTQQFKLPGAIRALAFSTHGRVLAAGLADGSVLLVPLKD